MNHFQRGALNMWWVAILSALLALVAMAALFSMRYERNLFAEAWAKVAGSAATAKIVDTAKEAAGVTPPTTALRRCTIDGKTVISNTECTDQNPTTKNIAIHDTRGIEAPKVPPKEEAAPTSNPAIDKMIEKQLH
jgi:hypothetical protein